MSIFCKVGISGFIGAIFIGIGVCAAQLIGLAITDVVSQYANICTVSITLTSGNFFCNSYGCAAIIFVIQFGRKVILLCGYLLMTVCLVAASILILVFGLESDVLSTEKTVAGYFVALTLMFFVGAAVFCAL